MSPEKIKTPEKQIVSVDVSEELAKRTKLIKKAGELTRKAEELKNETAGFEHEAKSKRAEASEPLFPSNVEITPNKGTELKATTYKNTAEYGANAGTNETGTWSVTHKKPFLAQGNYVDVEKSVVVFRCNVSSWEDSLSGNSEDIWMLLEVPFDQLESIEITEQESTA